MAFKNAISKLGSRINRELLKIRAKKRIKSIANLQEKDALILTIVKSAIDSPTSVLLIAPISQTKLIKLPNKDIFIILNGANVVISNHKFYYDIDISATLERVLSDRFVKKMERIHFSMQKEMVTGLNSGLDDLVIKIQQ